MGRSSGSRIGRFRMQVHAVPAWLWRFETSRDQELVGSAVKSKHIKVVKIAREVNAADSLACFSATHLA